MSYVNIQMSNLTFLGKYAYSLSCEESDKNDAKNIKQEPAAVQLSKKATRK